MNLIEKFGGYEKFKIALATLDSEKKDLLQCGNVTLVRNEIVILLLEYRRQHNIFEIGDKVVHIYDCENSMLFTVKDISDKGYSFGNDWGWYGVVSDMGVSHTFRHATDEEIAAGRRL